MNNNDKLGTIIHGIGASEVIDSSGEIISIEGIDTSSLDVDALINTEHESKTTSQLIGKVLSYKKIFKKEDCDNDHHRHFWDKVEAPYLYIRAVLFDKFGHTGAQDAVAMMKFDKSLNKEDTRQVCGFSIEGSRLDKEGNKITKCIARKISWTAYPCNKTCVAEILEEDDKPIEITAKQLLAVFKKSELMQSNLNKAETITSPKFIPKKTPGLQSLVPDPKKNRSAKVIEPKRSFTSESAPKNLRIGDRITYPKKPAKTKSTAYNDPDTWKNEENTIRKTILKSMSNQNIQRRIMLSEDKSQMRKEILKNLADDAFEHFEKKEQLVEFIKSQYPDMTEEQAFAFVRTYAYVQMKKSEMEMVKIFDQIEGNDLQKADFNNNGIDDNLDFLNNNRHKSSHEKAKKRTSEEEQKSIVNYKKDQHNRRKNQIDRQSRGVHLSSTTFNGNKSGHSQLGRDSEASKKYEPNNTVFQKIKNKVSGTPFKDSAKKRIKENIKYNKEKSIDLPKSEDMEKKDRCWEGYEPTPGKKAYSQGSCKPIKKQDSKTEEMKIDLKKPVKKSEIPSDEIHLYKYEDGTAEIIWGNSVSDDQVQMVIKTELEEWQEDLMSVEKKEKPFHSYNPKKHSKTGGLNDEYRKKINREEGSNLKRPVTGKVKPGSKAANRRKSFCARMSGVKGPTSKEGKLTPKGASLKRWKC